MFEEHPSKAELAGFLKGSSGPAKVCFNRRVLRHLLAECTVCKERLRSVAGLAPRFEPLLFEASRDVKESLAAAAYSYDAVFRKVEETLEGFLEPEPPPAEPLAYLLEALHATPSSGQAKLVEEEGRFAEPQLVDWLIEKSYEARYADPSEMLRWAHLAQLIATRCTLNSVGSNAKLEDLQARAWRQYGNALRVLGQLRESEEALQIARGHLERGTGDPVLRARQAEQVASLYTIQRRFPEALGETGDAVAIYRQLGDNHALARAIVTEAIACLYSGETESAIRRLNQAIPMIDHEEDPHLLLAACHNLVCCYVNLERPESALALYLESKDLYQEFSDPLIRLRYSWQEGALLRDLGQLRTAETTLQHTRAGFLEKGLTVEAAEVSLDLAAVYVKLKSFDDLKETVSATAVIFRTLGMDRDALASLLQLQQVAHEEQRALELVRSLAAQLEAVAKRGSARA